MNKFIKISSRFNNFSEEGVHENRVLFRKIETAAYITGVKKFKLKTEEYRKEFKILGKIRDLQLEIKNMEELVNKEIGIKKFQQSLKQELEIEMEKIVKNSSWFSKSFIEEIAEAAEKIEKAQIEKALKKLGIKAVNCMEEIEGDSDKIHKARKILKRVRYSLEIGYEKQTAEKTDVETAKEIQELLGSYIDSLNLYYRFCRYERANNSDSKLKELFKENVEKKYRNILEKRERIRSDIEKICRL